MRSSTITTPRDPQHWAEPQPFRRDEATVIRTAEKPEPGYWVGAPGAYFDPTDGFFYLLYRVRRPRGVGVDRGAEVRLARSRDGLEFEDLWAAPKTELDSPSIERCAIRRLGDDRWLLFLSYVDPADQRWRIDVVRATRPDRFDLAQRQPVLRAEPLGLEGVKDPGIFQIGGMLYMWVSIARIQDGAGASDPDALHGTADVYNTGLIQSATGLARSPDGIRWNYLGEVFAPEPPGSVSDEPPAWDAYCRRIGTVYREDGVWVAFYDGSASVEENYEERVGIATSLDLRKFTCTTPHAPWMAPEHHARRAFRYFDVLDFADRRLTYFEIARPDGSHDMCVAQQMKPSR